MRSSLLGLNALAMAAVATPAFLIFASSQRLLARNPTTAAIAVASLVVGCVSLFAAMQKLGAGRTALAFGLMAAGLGLVAAPVLALVFAPYV